jgi:ArsR family transcriptional regulator
VIAALSLTSVRQFDNNETVSSETGTRRRLAPGQFELISKALADPRRVGVLEAIADEQCCACQHLRDQFPVSKATISHHIKELVRAGMVEARREGQYLNCLVRRETLEAFAAELLSRVGSVPANLIDPTS